MHTIIARDGMPVVTRDDLRRLDRRRQPRRADDAAAHYAREAFLGAATDVADRVRDDDPDPPRIADAVTELVRCADRLDALEADT